MCWHVECNTLTEIAQLECFHPLLALFVVVLPKKTHLSPKPLRPPLVARNRFKQLLIGEVRECINKGGTIRKPSVQFSSVTQSCPTLCDPMNRSTPSLPCPSPTPGVHADSRPSSQWCHPAISSSVMPFSPCPQSLPASESFPMSQLFAWGGQSTGGSASASVLPMNTQDWSPLGWTGWISLQPKGLSRAFSNTTVQKHQFFGAQLSSQSNSHIHTWSLEKP